MFGSGQRRSSTSDPEHWLSFSPGTGRPESRSRQARKRLWSETTLLSLTKPAREVLNCTEANGKHGEHVVHADHSLRITGNTWFEKIFSLLFENMVVASSLTFSLSYLHTLSYHTAEFHHGTSLRTAKRGYHKSQIKCFLWCLFNCCAMSSVHPLGCYQVLQSLMTVPPWGTVTAMGGCPESWCCSWIQPHLSAGTQLPFRWSKPWKKNTDTQTLLEIEKLYFFLFLFLYSNIMCLWMCTASIEVFLKACKAAPL